MERVMNSIVPRLDARVHTVFETTLGFVIQVRSSRLDRLDQVLPRKRAKTGSFAVCNCDAHSRGNSQAASLGYGDDLSELNLDCIEAVRKHIEEARKY